VACAVRICAALFAAVLHHSMARRRLEESSRVAGLERDLTRQVAEKSGCEQSDLDAVRARVGRFRVKLGPADTWERLVRQLGRAWAGDADSREDRDGYSVQGGTFRLQSPATADWPQIVDSVWASEQLPGVGIVGFEMKTNGNHERRSVDLVKFVVAIQMLRPAAVP